MHLLAQRACILTLLPRGACLTSVRRADRPGFGVDTTSVVERGFFVQKIDPESVEHRILADDCLSLLEFPRVVIDLATKYLAG